MLSPTVSPSFAVPFEISVQELATRLNSSKPPAVAEILGPQYFASGHLPGAINLPLEGFAESAVRHLPNKSADIVVYCASATCQNSDIAARKLQSLGYQNVRLFRGGKAAWKDAGHPLVTG
ncbi:MAG TPA: rhodanese-like domain-containing protein [Polyangiaceae bacterium]|nr:rhodanese-like domain-containing protein [Polyangiaceae bacterium]